MATRPDKNVMLKGRVNMMMDMEKSKIYNWHKERSGLQQPGSGEHFFS